MRRFAVLFVALAACAPHATPRSSPFAKEFTDHGADLRHDPYVVPQSTDWYSQGRIVGFRKVEVDPEKFPDTLAPVAPGTTDGAPATGDLPVVDDLKTWADVEVNGQKIGRIAPMVAGRITNVKWGAYDLKFTAPDGFVWTRHVQTIPAGERVPSGLGATGVGQTF